MVEISKIYILYLKKGVNNAKKGLSKHIESPFLVFLKIYLNRMLRIKTILA